MQAKAHLDLVSLLNAQIIELANSEVWQRHGNQVLVLCREAPVFRVAVVMDQQDARLEPVAKVNAIWSADVLDFADLLRHVYIPREHAPSAFIEDVRRRPLPQD